MQNKAVGRIITQAVAIKPVALVSMQGYRLLWRTACLKKTNFTPWRRLFCSSISFTFTNQLQHYTFYHSCIRCVCIVCATPPRIMFAEQLPVHFIQVLGCTLHIETLHTGSGSSGLLCALVHFKVLHHIYLCMRPIDAN